MTPIQFSPQACLYIKQRLLKEQGVGFRLSVKKTGCSGYSYVPSIVQTLCDKDVVIEVEDLKVYVDPSWLHVLQGVKVDYIQEEKAGLKQKRLVFINTNEKSRCGCGESFQI